MDKTYYYLYKKLYSHFYMFCTTGNTLARDAINDMKKDIDDVKDKDLSCLYDIINNIVRIDNSSFSLILNDYSSTVSLNEDERIWQLHSILYLTYQYVFPNRKLAENSKKLMNTAENNLIAAGITNYKTGCETADYMIQMHINKKSVANDAYQQEFEKRDFRLNNRSYMAILKGFSSSTPFFYQALRERFHNVPIKGGGFFLKWKGYGIAIDPGISYMENMHSIGLNIDDINAVFVTHNHIDHNGDLPTIDDLASQFHKEDIVLYLDKQTEMESAHRLVSFSDKNRHGLDLTVTKFLEIGVANNIRVDLFPTKHIMEGNEYVENQTYALKLSLLDDEKKPQVVIGFTSDTVYMDELSDFFKGCDYIIANISETSGGDYSGKSPKKNHLGYNGCLRLVNNCCEDKQPSRSSKRRKKNRFIISEFWAGKGDVRKDLVKALRNDTKHPYIYPGDIGMLFFLDQPTFLCNSCGKEEKIENLSVIRPGAEYTKFLYICSECILS